MTTGRTEKEMDLLTEMDALRARGECLYVRGADGTMYLEVALPNGSCEYVPAEPGLAYHELPNGKWMAVRDVDVAQRQAESASHLQRFVKDSQEGRAFVKQNMIRVDRLGELMQQLAVDRASPVGAPNIQTIKDEELEGFLAMYQKALAENCANQCDFQPLNSYAHKLITKTGRVLRPLYKGEVGMYGNTVLVLEQGYGEGNFVSVPAQVGGGDE